jgi:protein required for attachment to host cells
VVVADAAHARVLVLEPDRDTDETAASELVEVAEITNPMVRARSSAAAGHNGRRGRTPPQGIPEYQDHRRAIERHFAAEIAEEAAAVWSCYPPCELIVAAGPGMLAALRPAIHERTGGPIDPAAIRELARELTRLTVAQLHDELIGADLLPPRATSAIGRGEVARRR